MFRRSSPPGSPSLRKLRNVLHTNPSFHMNFPGAIFQTNQAALSSMFRGYGLIEDKSTGKDLNCSGTTLLVETLLNSHCPIGNPKFWNHSRIIIQTEQTIKGKLGTCHASPNCIIIEFSEHNYRQLQEKGWADSTVLLPIMHQQPSRLQLPPPPPQNEKLQLTPLANRSIDVSFFGLMTKRRKKLQESRDKFLEKYPNRTIQLRAVRPLKTQVLSQAYADSKVCLVAHSYRAKSGGEYHRLSEFAPFGCIPIMEEFADSIGIERYKECGRVVFGTTFDNLFVLLEDVLSSIDAGVYYNDPDEFSHVKWWSAGVKWESLLETFVP